MNTPSPRQQSPGPAASTPGAGASAADTGGPLPAREGLLGRGSAHPQFMTRQLRSMQPRGALRGGGGARAKWGGGRYAEVAAQAQGLGGRLGGRFRQKLQQSKDRIQEMRQSRR